MVPLKHASPSHPLVSHPLFRPDIPVIRSGTPTAVSRSGEPTQLFHPRLQPTLSFSLLKQPFLLIPLDCQAYSRFQVHFGSKS
jgi:hypothetical protein